MYKINDMEFDLIRADLLKADKLHSSNIEAIKQEIRRRMGVCGIPDGSLAKLIRFDELKSILSFIESLEKE